jgi:16S rRNA (uracil1498-N3)-methyltransferase
MTIRVFSDVALAVDERVTLSADERHYAVRVRRAKVGSELEVLDGAVVHRAVVEYLDERSCVVRSVELARVPCPDALELWLGLPDPTAALASITAACELGATRIVLVRCKFSPAAVPSRARIERVVRAAQRQCGCPRAPEIDGPVAIAELLEHAAPPLGAFAWERLRDETRDRTGPSDIGPDTVRRLLVGPEGGLADEEAEACLARGMLAISLGPWTQRTETAVAAGLARMQATARALPRR